MGSQGRAYAWADEALRDSRVNAEKMRTDCAIMECLEARMRATALLNWHIVPEDENDPKQKALADDMTRIFRRIPQFTKLRWSLLEALWYGRSGVALQYGSEKIDGKLRTVVKRWEPRHGDKLVFRYDDGSGQYDADQVGIRVGAAYQNDPETQDYLGNRRRKIEATQYGLAYWLDQWERRLIAVHKHIVEDGPWEDPVRAGAIHGVGIRDRIYWTWYGMIECLANVLNYLERSAFGVEIWTYPAGNDQAKQRTEEAAKRVISGGRTVLIVPRFQGEDADLYGVQHIEPGLGGVDAAMSIVREYFGHKIKRYILGQTLSSEPDATGMGSGVADLQAATFADIVKFDAVNLEETITTDLLRWSQLWNFPHSRDTYLRFVIDTDSPDAQRKMEGYRTAWDMGARIREEDVLSTIGASVPKDDDRVLLNPAMQQQQPMSPDGQHYGALSIHGPGLSGQSGEGPANQIPLGPIDPDRYSARDDVEAAAAQTVEPTEAQRESGNYRKGKVRLHGMEISIENAKGSSRRPEWPPLSAHYGYIRGTEGRDGDHVDCYIGPHPDSELVYVIDQENKGGRFDEHKVMLGFTNAEKAKTAYLANYPAGWRCGPVTAMTVQQFKSWLESGDTNQRLAGQVSKYTAHWEEQPRDEDGKFAEKVAPPKDGESQETSKNPTNPSKGQNDPSKESAESNAEMNARHAREAADLEATHEREFAKLEKQREREDTRIWRLREREDDRIGVKRDNQDDQINAREQQELESSGPDGEDGVTEKYRGVWQRVFEARAEEDRQIDDARDREDQEREARRQEEDDEITARHERELDELDARHDQEREALEDGPPDLYSLMLRADLDRIASVEKYKVGWITIGGGEEDGKKHVGGTRVYIGKGGKIMAGPKALEGRKLRDLGKRKGKPERKPRPEKEDRATANLRAIAREVAGDDKEDQDGFIALVKDLHREKVGGAEEYNDQLKHFWRHVATSPGREKALRARIMLAKHRGADATSLRGFDEIHDFAKKYTPALLSVPGESGHDEESALIENLSRGRLPVPRLDDDEIINEALEYAQSRTSDWDSSELEEMRAIPFTSRGRPDVYARLLRRDVECVEKYASRNRRWDESKVHRGQPDNAGQFAKNPHRPSAVAQFEGEAEEQDIPPNQSPASLVADPTYAALAVIEVVGTYFTPKTRSPEQVIEITDIYDDEEDFVYDAISLSAWLGPSRRISQDQARSCRAVTVPLPDGTARILAKEYALSGGALIHEYVHAFSTQHVAIQCGSITDDGIAEYFTRIAVSDLRIDRASLNLGAYGVVAQIATLVGEKPLGSALIGGDVDGLREAVDNKLGKGAWSEIVGHLEKGDYESAHHKIGRRSTHS